MYVNPVLCWPHGFRLEVSFGKEWMVRRMSGLVIVKEQHAWIFDPTLDPVVATQRRASTAWSSHGPLFFYTYQCNNTQPYCNVIFCSFPFTGPVHGIIAIDDGAILSGKEGCGDGGGDGSWCCHGGTEQQAEVKYVHTRTHIHIHIHTHTQYRHRGQY